jgi:CubicO group peptidase (beta-lactamase class C family)
MLLAHRSGLGEAPHQFAWDTASTFSPDYRPACPPELLEMPLDRFLIASLTPQGSNYDEAIWVAEPDISYHYALIGAPLLRYMIERVTGQSFPDHMRQSIFEPLGMTSSGYSAELFAGRNTIPHTRVDDRNVALPIWNGNGYMMRTTAEDQASFMIPMMRDGRARGHQLLGPETVELMRTRTSRFKVLFGGGPDLQRSGEGLGLNIFRGGWYGFGGSTPGYQCLWRFHPSREVGFVILSNVNAILSGGHNYASARSEIYEVQNALLAVLDPALKLRSRIGEALIIIAIVGFWGTAVVALWRRGRAWRDRR